MTSRHPQTPNSEWATDEWTEDSNRAAIVDFAFLNLFARPNPA